MSHTREDGMSRIRSAEQYRRNVRAKMAALEIELRAGISRTYTITEDGKTLQFTTAQLLRHYQQWERYYTAELRQLRKQAVAASAFAVLTTKAKQLPVATVLLLSLVVALGLAAVLRPEITGFAAKEPKLYTDTVARTFTEDGLWTFTPEQQQADERITSLKLTGKVSGSGTARVLLGGKVVIEYTLAPPEIVTPEAVGGSNATLEGAPPNASENASGENITTAEVVAEPVEAPAENVGGLAAVTGAAVIETGEEQFTLACVDSCVLDIPRQDSYALIVEVSGVTLEIDTASYTVREVGGIPQENVVENITANVSTENATAENLTNATVNVTANVTPSGMAQLSLSLKDKDKRDIETELALAEVVSEDVATVAYRGDKLKHDALVPEGIYLAVLKPKQHLVKEIAVENLSIEDGMTDIMDIDDMPETAVSKLSRDKPDWAELYAIDPKANYSSATVTLTAKATKLYKCKEWDFVTRTCGGSWQPYLDLTPGQNYTITLSTDDPGFGEINITDARHLDADYSFISNVYEEVRTQDDVWSEQIPEDHYVRATFERTLFTDNVVNLIARAQQNTESTLELYEANTTNLVASTGTLSETSQQYNLELQNLPNGSAELDIKVVNADPAANRWVEFDWIHDAAGFPNVSYVSPRNGTELVLRRAMNISANVTDDTQLSWIVASVQVPNGTKLNITMFNSTTAWNTTQPPNNFSVLFNDTSQLGTYIINVWANDTSNNLNDTITSNISIDTPNITFIFPTPSNNSGAGGGGNSLTLNTTVADGSSNTSAFFDFNRTLVGYWAMDWYNSTGVFDNSSYSAGDTNTQIGVFTGTGFGTANITAGKYGQALEFDGVNDYLSCTDANCGGPTRLDIGLRNWTAMAWIRTSANNPKFIMSKVGFYSSGPDGWHLGLGVNGRLQGGIRDQDTGQQVISTDDGAQLGDGLWHHVAITYNRSGAMRRYVDGSVSGTENSIAALATNTIDNSLSFRIGARDAAGDELFYDDDIDEVRVFSRVLSAAEVNASFNAGAYRLERNFTNLYNGTYNYTACAIDVPGNYNCTALQYANVNTVFPNVSYLNSTGGAVVPETAVNISANVTDDTQLSGVFASITKPDSSIVNITMLNATVAFNRSQSPDNFSITFNDTSAAGTYIIRIGANDTANNMNDTVTSRFTVTADTTFPNVSYINTSDGFGSSVFGRRTPVNISVNVTDNIRLSFIALSIQVPNGTFLPNISMLNGSTQFNHSQSPDNFTIRFNDTSQTGTYILRVLANDTSNNMNDTITSRFDVTSVVSFTILTSSISFGSLANGELQDTADDTPVPFRFENDGNVAINLTVNGTAVFSSLATNSSSYQFQCGTSAGGSPTESACNSPAPTSFTNLPLANISVAADKKALAIFDLPWQSTNDSLAVDIRVNVPDDEPGGAKTSTITIEAVEATP